MLTTILLIALIYIVLGVITTIVAITTLRDGAWLMIPTAFGLCVVSWPYLLFVIASEKLQN
jgi:hypothetical protein